MNLEGQLEELIESRNRISTQLKELDIELSGFPVEENFDLKTKIVLEKHLAPVLRKLQILNGVNQENVFQRLWQMVSTTTNKPDSVAVLLLQTDIQKFFKENKILKESVREQLERLDASRRLYYERIRDDLSKEFDELSYSVVGLGTREELLRKKSFLERDLIETSSAINELEAVLLDKKTILSSGLASLMQEIGAGVALELKGKASSPYGPLNLLSPITTSLLTDDLAQQLLVSKAKELQVLLSARIEQHDFNDSKKPQETFAFGHSARASELKDLAFELSRENFEIFYLDDDERSRIVSSYFEPNTSMDVRLDFCERTLLGTQLNHLWFLELIERSESLALARMNISKWLQGQRGMNLNSFADYLCSRYPAVSASEELAIAWVVGVTDEGRIFPEFLMEI